MQLWNFTSVHLCNNVVITTEWSKVGTCLRASRRMWSSCQLQDGFYWSISQFECPYFTLCLFCCGSLSFLFVNVIYATDSWISLNDSDNLTHEMHSFFQHIVQFQSLYIYITHTVHKVCAVYMHLMYKIHRLQYCPVPLTILLFFTFNFFHVVLALSIFSVYVHWQHCKTRVEFLAHGHIISQ